MLKYHTVVSDVVNYEQTVLSLSVFSSGKLHSRIGEINSYLQVEIILLKSRVTLVQAEHKLYDMFQIFVSRKLNGTEMWKLITVLDECCRFM